MTLPTVIQLPAFLEGGHFLLVIIARWISFSPKINLQRMTPEETRITSLTAEPYPDGYRLHVNIEITPFQKAAAY